MKHLLLILFGILIAGHSYSQVTGVVPAVDSETIKKVDSTPVIVPQGLAKEVTIRKIIVTGNDITKRSIILRELNVQEGDKVPSADLEQIVRENRLRLINLTLFNDAEITFKKISREETDAYIYVKERWFILPQFTLQLADRNFNVWFVEQHHDINRINIGLTAIDKNFRGNLETLSATVQVGYTQKLGLTYLCPYIDKKQKSGLGFSVNMAKSQQTYYTTDSDKQLFIGNYGGPNIIKNYNAAVSYVYRPGYYTRHTLQLSYNYYWVGDTVVGKNPDFFADSSNIASYLGLVYRFEYNGVDNWNYPLLGNKLVTTTTLLAGFKGIKFQGSVYVEAGMFRRILPKWYTSVIFRGQVMVPGKQPYYFLSGLGTQVSYVRGYEYYMIDGPDYGLLRLDLKRELFSHLYKNIPIKYFGAVPLRIYPKVFVDVGGIYSGEPGNSFLNNRLLYSAGVGVDIVTLYDIKIRLEYAYNHLGQNALYLHTNSE